MCCTLPELESIADYSRPYKQTCNLVIEGSGVALSLRSFVQQESLRVSEISLVFSPERLIQLV
jgi:hypothetical protein